MNNDTKAWRTLIVVLILLILSIVLPANSFHKEIIKYHEQQLQINRNLLDRIDVLERRD